MPVLAAEGVGPISAIRRAPTLLRSKWGESLAGEARFGLLGTVLCLQALLIFLVGLVLSGMRGTTLAAAAARPRMTNQRKRKNAPARSSHS